MVHIQHSMEIYIVKDVGYWFNILLVDKTHCIPKFFIFLEQSYFPCAYSNCDLFFYLHNNPSFNKGITIYLYKSSFNFQSALSKEAMLKNFACLIKSCCI